MKRISAIFLTVVMLFVFAGCAGSEGGASSTPANTESEVTSSEPQLAVNPLTGERTLELDAVNKRPIAIMINNNRASLPQRGISQADILYEVPAEGGITRIMALFADINKIPDIGSLRSARYYYLALASSHNAIFCHFGGERDALNYIKNNNIKTINFISTAASYRDKNRVGKYAYEHTAFTDGERLKKAINYRKIETDATISSAFNFGDNSSAFSQGSVATNITVPFSSSTKATFTYDADSGMYLKGQFNAAQIDETTGKQIEVKNVFVLQTSISLKNANSSANYINVDLTSGFGYYACDGKIIPIKWEKGNDLDAKLKYYTTDGKELSVATGKTWVNIISSNNTVSYN
ncbi:MAG: DUF3048 domain-containing protein [Ruminococcaceae bacterium]|nr:DUF3048 domain-containing protein [Oscillospiraceae bacterium]